MSKYIILMICPINNSSMIIWYRLDKRESFNNCTNNSVDIK